MKKKVIVLVIDTELPNDEIEGVVGTTVWIPIGGPRGDEHRVHDARNVRVIDVDEITGELEAPRGISAETYDKVLAMIQGKGTSRQALWDLLCHEIQKGNS